jgi:transposase InsO family protein
MADHMRTELVVDALQMALTHRRPAPGLIWHSDQGSLTGLNRSSQHEALDERTVAVGVRVAMKIAWLSSRRLARRAGRSGESHARAGRPGSAAA